MATSAGATEKTLVQFQPKPALQLSAIQKTQGIIGHYLIDVDPDMLYQAAKTGPNRPIQTNQNRSKRPQTDLMLLPVDQNFQLRSSIHLEPTHYGQYVKKVDTFSGIVNGDETTSFVLSIESRRLYGQVQLGN